MMIPTDDLAEMIVLIDMIERGAGQPFDHPDARALSKAGPAARSLLERIRNRFPRRRKPRDRQPPA